MLNYYFFSLSLSSFVVQAPISLGATHSRTVGSVIPFLSLSSCFLHSRFPIKTIAYSALPPRRFIFFRTISPLLSPFIYSDVHKRKRIALVGRFAYHRAAPPSSPCCLYFRFSFYGLLISFEIKQQDYPHSCELLDLTKSYDVSQSVCTLCVRSTDGVQRRRANALYRRTSQKPDDELIQKFKRTFSDVMPGAVDSNISADQGSAEVVDRSRYITPPR